MALNDELVDGEDAPICDPGAATAVCVVETVPVRSAGDDICRLPPVLDFSFSPDECSRAAPLFDWPPIAFTVGDGCCWIFEVTAWPGLLALVAAD